MWRVWNIIKLHNELPKTRCILRAHCELHRAPCAQVWTSAAASEWSRLSGGPVFSSVAVVSLEGGVPSRGGEVRAGRRRSARKNSFRILNYKTAWTLPETP